MNSKEGLETAYHVAVLRHVLDWIGDELYRVSRVAQDPWDREQFLAFERTVRQLASNSRRDTPWIEDIDCKKYPNNTRASDKRRTLPCSKCVTGEHELEDLKNWESEMIGIVVKRDARKRALKKK